MVPLCLLRSRSSLPFSVRHTHPSMAYQAEALLLLTRGVHRHKIPFGESHTPL
jgi:hypothetical protein